MGASQSTPHFPSEAEAKRILLEKIHNMTLDTAEDDYIHVDEKGVALQKTSRAQWTPLIASKVVKWEEELLSDPKNRLALSALSSADPRTVLTSRTTLNKDQQIFSVKIPFEGAPITNQRQSGRCWLFASTNVFRVALMKRHNLKEFELSQAYLFFWDKLEKSNYFLEQILDTAGEDLDGRLVQTLLATPVSDGGQWDMVYNIVHKYGLVPQVLYPDSFNAQTSSVINSIITTKLREDALKLRAAAATKSASTLNNLKEHMVRQIHLILTLALGPPPASDTAFTWQYLDKDDKAQELKATPIEFAKELNTPKSMRITNSTVHDMFSLVNDPRNEYNTLLTVDRLGNIVGGRPITYINVPMSTMKSACIAMLKADLPIFFGSDVGKYSNSQKGIMDLDLIDYELGFNIKLGMTKAQRLMTGESAMTHAMVLTAVHLDDEGKSVRWRVQNSWGEGAGTDGWFVMSDEWMDQFVYQAVVEPRFVSREIRDILKTVPKVLNLWDPMGALA
ncbi:putative Cysteine proteinase 1, mitochondrial [Sclerotinia borealis F-4128]|uniref:Cysteine proteinase 1, mitochondrial n=1 Tax=Sclerotinia borealis (strain F-4128) TaxID=1432307 RepID=W9CEN4_SCLBF|nr:putative Cysteine proteinase 1, mitochondrial [Sclerotinia borealis F-4128]